MRRTVVRSVAALLAVSTNRWPKAYARSTVSSHPFRASSPSYEHSSMAWLPLQRSGPPPQQQQQQGVLASKVANNALYRSSGVVSAAALRGGGGAGAVADSLQVSRGGQQQRATAASTGGVRRSVKICTLFILSFGCSVGFNVNNKRASLLVPLPWTYAALNLLIGAVVSLAAWFVKAAPWPRISRQDIAVLVPMGLLHAVSHLTVVLGLGAGAVSFLQTVKASEACFTALLSFLFLGQTLPLPVYLTLLPVVVGVGITSCNQIKFSWLALLSALVSNLTNALRNVLIVRNIGPAAAGNRRKASPSSALGAAIRNHPMTSAWNGAAALVNTRAGSAKVPESGLANLAPGDTYRLLTVVGAILLFPAAAYFERGSWPRLWQGATDATAALLGRGAPGLAESSAVGEGVGGGVSTLAEAAVAASRGDWAEAFQRAIVSGLCFNLFYDLTFRLLGQLHPVTHAVGNTVKRIVVIAAGAFAFGGDLGGTRSALGSALAVAGVLGYSVAKARCKPITTTRRSA